MQSIPIAAIPTKSFSMPNDSEYKIDILANYCRQMCWPLKWRPIEHIAYDCYIIQYVHLDFKHPCHEVNFKCRWAHIFLPLNLTKKMHPQELETKTEDVVWLWTPIKEVVSTIITFQEFYPLPFTFTLFKVVYIKFRHKKITRRKVRCK